MRMTLKSVDAEVCFRQGASSKSTIVETNTGKRTSKCRRKDSIHKAAAGKQLNTVHFVHTSMHTSKSFGLSGAHTTSLSRAAPTTLWLFPAACTFCLQLQRLSGLDVACVLVVAEAGSWNHWLQMQWHQRGTKWRLPKRDQPLHWGGDFFGWNLMNSAWGANRPHMFVVLRLRPPSGQPATPPPQGPRITDMYCVTRLLCKAMHHW